MIYIYYMDPSPLMVALLVIYRPFPLPFLLPLICLQCCSGK